MAFSAFKSNRSKSVTPLSRTNETTFDLSPPNDLFTIKIDNPLYCCSSSASSSSSTNDNNAKIEKAGSLNEEAASGRARRGRSVSRSSGIGNQSSERRLRSVSRSSGIGSNNGRGLRSVSRSSGVGSQASARSSRSISRGHYDNSETDIEHQYKSTSNSQGKGDDKSVASKGPKNSIISDEEFVDKEQTKNLTTWTSRHPVSEFSDAPSSFCRARSWEDYISTSSFSEVEDTKPLMRHILLTDVDSDNAIFQTIRSETCMAAPESRDNIDNVFWSEDPSIHTTENIIDIPPEFLDPEELYCDEYVSKLEQAKERARKLRADLAIEEQREQELSRIVENISHAPTISKPRKPRPKRRASMEKTRMSRQLAEEAMNYFDECVSISTFESSDFSSFEDPQSNSAAGVNRMSSSRFSDTVIYHEELDCQTQCFHSVDGSDTPLDETMKLSYAHDHDIRQFVNKFEKGSRKESFEHQSTKTNYSAEEYSVGAKSESLVFDAFILRNRIEYGGLLLCNGRTFS